MSEVRGPMQLGYFGGLDGNAMRRDPVNTDGGVSMLQQ